MSFNSLHVFRSFGALFAKVTSPIASLMENENFSKFYREAYGIHINMRLLKSWFDLKAHKQPGWRIIEIGAGTASTTLPVLNQLGKDSEMSPPSFSHWTFTDISAGWFENAKNTLHDRKSRVEYKVLDIDKDIVVVVTARYRGSIKMPRIFAVISSILDMTWL
ncbi:hypothetical protein HRG_004557 [Hirsutella rhossiliensis]|uniref:Uncharacterized protein n=1 Tax=Hirsutella rhossiliensis TaxID=111463 RepID=A0A9P8SJE8_9HYPO|nr:uncharacterized protein HRG_04557 [Hirsutella rhossiliensis]KAH0964129.1 hypothetical protein HRG_04557 [Hirsutella rhossiliensis]